MKTNIFRYDVKVYPFRDLVSAQLGMGELEQIDLGHELFTRENDQRTEAHRRFYKIGEEFYSVYRRFVRDLIQPIFKEDVVYQKVPTFRIALPGNVSVGEFHRDRDYGHSREEINFLLPLTKAFDTNTIWIESSEGLEDYQPQTLEYGQVLVFDGANLKHGNHANRTGRTRVSFDLRVIPMSKYVPSDRKTINTKIPFSIGGYWDVVK